MDIQRNVKIKSETADTERIGFLHSLKAKILLLVAGSGSAYRGTLTMDGYT